MNSKRKVFVANFNELYKNRELYRLWLWDHSPLYRYTYYMSAAASAALYVYWHSVCGRSGMDSLARSFFSLLFLQTPGSMIYYVRAKIDLERRKKKQNKRAANYMRIQRIKFNKMWDGWSDEQREVHQRVTKSWLENNKKNK